LIEYAESIVKSSEVKILLVHDPKQDLLDVSTEDVTKFMSRIVENNEKIFVDYRILKIPSLTQLFKSADKYVPKNIYVSDSAYTMTKMETDSIYATRCYQGPDWEIKKMPTNLYNKVFKTLETNSERDFKAQTPECLHGYWYLIKTLFDKHFYI
jgi:hypothetical protein